MGEVDSTWDNETWALFREEIKKHFGTHGREIPFHTSVQIIQKPVIQFVKTEEGDWIGCYLNGELIDQGHSLYVVHLLETLSDHLGFIVSDTVFYDYDQMDKLGGNFPDRQEDIDAQLK